VIKCYYNKGEVMNFLEVLIVWCLILLFGVFVGGLAIQYTVEYWLSSSREEPVDVSYGWCCVGGFFFGWNIGIPAAIITKIVSSISD